MTSYGLWNSIDIMLDAIKIDNFDENLGKREIALSHEKKGEEIGM